MAAPLSRALSAVAVVVVLLGGVPLSLGGALPPALPHAQGLAVGVSHHGESPVPTERTLRPASGAAPVNEWATYLQNPERTSANLAERTLNRSNASQLVQEWEVKTNGSDFGSPTVVNGTVYAGSWNGYEYAINATNGTVLWKTFLGTDPNCSWGNPMGIDGSAAIWNGTVYVGGGNDDWYALNASNGSVVWKIKVINDSPSGGGFNWASPLLYDGAEYIGIASCIDSPLVQGQILMVNLTGNHSVLHTFDTVPAGQVGATVWTTPAVDPAANVLWFADGNDDGSDVQNLSQSILALNASTLQLLGSWQVPNVDGQDSDFGGGTILFHDASGRELVGASNKNGVFYALNRSNVTTNGSWNPVWEEPNASGFSPSAFDGTTLYLGTGPTTIDRTAYSGSVQAIDPSNGTVLWTAPAGGMVYGAVVYADGLVFAGGGSVLTVINSSSGNVVTNLTISSALSIEGAPSVENGQVFYEAGDSGTSGAFYAAGIPLGPIALSERPSNGSAPLSVAFSAAPSGGLPPYNVSWSFGDGAVGWGASPGHVYDRSGTYNVSVTVRDERNTTAVSNETVLVRAPLVASIASTSRTGAAPWNVTFYGSASNGSGPPYELSWSFGDGTPNSTGPVVTHEYLSAGTYHANLTATDPDHRVANSSVTVVVTPSLNASVTATPTDGVAPLNVSLVSTVVDGTPPYQLLWAFGDQSPGSNATTVVHSYWVPGNYTAVLTVTDARGERHVVSTAVEVTAAAIPLAASITESNATAGCPDPSFVTSVSGSATGGSSPYTYVWSFGDGSAIATGDQQVHRYTASGVYDLALTVNDSGGNSVTASTTVTVHLASCTPPPATKSTSSSGGPPVWEYAVGIGLAVLVVAALGAVLWRRRSNRPT
jgi:PKD repeat protein